MAGLQQPYIEPTAIAAFGCPSSAGPIVSLPTSSPGPSLRNHLVNSLWIFFSHAFSQDICVEVTTSLSL